MVNVITINSFQAIYQEEIADLILNIQQNEFTIDINLADQPDLTSIEDFYIKPGGNFLVALDGDSVIGTTALIKISNNNYVLRKMFVKQAYRGKAWKVAEKLLQEALSWLQKQAAHTVYLGTIDKYQAAIRFYEKHGFQEINKSQLPKDFPLMKVDNRFFKFDF